MTFRAFFLTLLISVAALGQAPKTNVVLILADDLGTLDLHRYGSDDLYTPNLDALAERGVSLRQHYVAAAVCSPSRGALLTGRYPYRNGVISNSRSLYQGEVTIAEMLKPAGYRTALIGKWHLGEKTPPGSEGFDYSLFHYRGCIDNFSHFNYGRAPWGAPPHRHDLYRNGREIWASGTHFGDLIVREAIQFVEANADDPFFLFLPFNTPHYPIQPYDKHRARYAGLDEPRRSYAALVSTLDEQVGVILDKLEEVGVRERTLVIFLSDHGHSTEARTNHGGGNPGPYRGAKFSLFEGGIRVPAIASLPGVIPENQWRDQMTISCDWYPTIAAVTGVRLPERELDGRNILPVLKSASAPTPHDVLHWQYGNPEQEDPQWAIREGHWKLVVNSRGTKHGSKVSGDEKVFLSDMDADVTERNNLAGRHSDVVKRLTARHDTWLAEVLAEASVRQTAGATLSGQPPAEFDFLTSAELEGHTETLSPKLGERKIASEGLGRYDGHNMVMIHREADGEAEVHEKIVDIFVVQTGAGKLVVGGEAVDPVKKSAGEIRGSSIRGGVTRDLRPGDVAHIPANMPHQVLVPPGGHITYMIVKIVED